MKFYQLAFRYLCRKKSKTLILLLVLLLINSMILSSYIILHATENSRLTMQEKTGTKLVLECKDRENFITENDIELLEYMDGDILYINRLASNAVYPIDFNPVTNSDSEEDNNFKVSLLSYDDLERDSAFSELRYRLLEGSMITEGSEKGAVVNFVLADANGLEIGDELKVGTEIGNMISVRIIGIFAAGSERKQMDTLPSVNRVENQIFIDNQSYMELFDKAEYHKTAIYIKDPKQMDALEHKIKELFGYRVKITTSDTLYRQLEVPLNQIVRVMKLLLIFTLIAGITIISLLLCMWMRSRKREFAVFVSMGKGKISIIMQIFLETASIFCLSVFGACAIGGGISGIIESVLLDGNTAVILSVSLQVSDIVSMLMTSGFVVAIAVCISLLPILGANPKEVLSKMEG